MEQQQQSVFRTEALRRYPTANVYHDGPYAVVMYDGRFHVHLFHTLEEAKTLAGTGFRIEYYGPKVKPITPRWWEEDD